MKKILMIICLTLIITLVACTSGKIVYLNLNIEEIKKIEIVKYPYNEEDKVIYIVLENDMVDFMVGLNKIEFKSYTGQIKARSDIKAFIYYVNGAIVIVGEYKTEKITKNGAHITIKKVWCLTSVWYEFLKVYVLDFSI